MRRMLTLALIAAVASPALSAPARAGKGRMTIPNPPTAPKLRGALGPDAGLVARGAAPAAAAVANDPAGAGAAERLFLPSPIAAAASSSGGPQACRAACAQTYYFCAAAGDDEACPSRWALCRSSCDAPSPVQSFAPR